MTTVPGEHDQFAHWDAQLADLAPPEVGIYPGFPGSAIPLHEIDEASHPATDYPFGGNAPDLTPGQIAELLADYHGVETGTERKLLITHGPDTAGYL